MSFVVWLYPQASKKINYIGLARRMESIPYKRSAYHLAKESVDAENGCCSSNEHVKALWRKVRRIKGPRVVQHFL
jgi:hypothetical protein